LTGATISRRPVIGFALVGVSAAALLAVAARQLDPAAFRVIGLAWTVSTIFGMGIASPVEQAITRQVSSLTGGCLGLTRWLVLAGLVTGVLVVAWSRSLDSASDRTLFVATSLVALTGWGAVAPSRGVVAGLSQFDRYSTLLFVESGIRGGFVILALLDAPQAAWLLGAGIGAPGTLVGVWAWLRWSRGSVHATWRQRETKTHLWAFVAVSTGFQACLSGPVFLVDWVHGEGEAAAVGEFVAANTYFRAPALVVGGLTVQALAQIGNAYSRGDWLLALHIHRSMLKRSLVLVGGASAVAVLCSPLALPLYLGAQMHMPWPVLLSLGLSTPLAMAGAVTVQSLLAGGYGVHAASAWLLGSAVMSFIAVLALNVERQWWDSFLVALLLAGPAVSLAAATRWSLRLFRSRTSPPRDNSSCQPRPHFPPQSGR
jgi:hypothetical protein